MVTAISIGGHGVLSIRGNDALQERLSILRQRVSGNAANKPIGRQIFTALMQWEREVRALLHAQYGALTEYQQYDLAEIPTDGIEEAERLNATGQAAAQAQGATYTCRMAGCQHRVLAHGALCPRCAHDAE